MPPPDPALDALLDAALPHVPFDGWSERSFAQAAREAGMTREAARALAPRGAVDLAVAWHRRGDRAMVAALPEAAALRLRERVAHALKARAREMGAHREALRRSATLLARPDLAPLGPRLLWETADALWTALGDRSRDGNWYTKRATLAAVQGAVALYAMGDDSPGMAATDAFIDRRIDEVMAFEKWKARAAESRVLGPLARPLGRLMGMVRAPVTPPDLPGGGVP